MSSQTDVNNKFIKYLSSITNEKGKRAFTGRDLNKLLRWEAQDSRFEGLLEHAANSIDNYREAVEFKKDLQNYFTKPTIFTADRDGNLIVLARNIPAGQEDFANKTYNIHDVRLARGLIHEESLAEIVANTFNFENLRNINLRSIGRAAGYAGLLSLIGLAGCSSLQADDYATSGMPGKDLPNQDLAKQLPAKAVKADQSNGPARYNYGGILSRYQPNQIGLNQFAAFGLDSIDRNSPDLLLHSLTSANARLVDHIKLSDYLEFLLKAEAGVAGFGTFFNGSHSGDGSGEFKVVADGSAGISLSYDLAPLLELRSPSAPIAQNLQLPENMFTVGLHAKGRSYQLEDANVQKERYLDFGLESFFFKGPFQLHLITSHSLGGLNQRDLQNGYETRDKVKNFGRAEICYAAPFGLDFLAHVEGGKIQRDVKGPNGFRAEETFERINFGGAVIYPDRNGWYIGLFANLTPYQLWESTGIPRPDGRKKSSQHDLGILGGLRIGPHMYLGGSFGPSFSSEEPKNSLQGNVYFKITF